MSTIKAFVANTLSAMTFGCAMFLAQPAMSQSGSTKHQLVREAELNWVPSFMGCEHANVSGDPTAEGKPFVLRIRCPDGAKVPPHWHPTDENITVLKGNFMVGTGEVFDSARVTPMEAGNYIFMPKTMRHFALCKGDTVIQVHGIGPFKIVWLNPAEVVPTSSPATKNH